MIEDYISKVKKVTSKRKSKISNSIGMNEAYRFYKKNCGKLTSQEFRKSIHLINLALQESIARGEDLTIPQKMGELQLRKFNTNIDFTQVIDLPKARTDMMLETEVSLKNIECSCAVCNKDKLHLV